MAKVFVIMTKVKNVERKQQVLRSVPNGKDESGKTIWKTEYKDLGWFVTFEGSHEALHTGFENEPMAEIGQDAEIRIRLL